MGGKKSKFAFTAIRWLVIRPVGSMLWLTGCNLDCDLERAVRLTLRREESNQKNQKEAVKQCERKGGNFTKTSECQREKKGLIPASQRESRGERTKACESQYKNRERKRHGER